jgi:hypothetical protein
VEEEEEDLEFLIDAGDEMDNLRCGVCVECVVYGVAKPHFAV